MFYKTSLDSFSAEVLLQNISAEVDFFNLKRSTDFVDSFFQVSNLPQQK